MDETDLVHYEFGSRFIKWNIVCRVKRSKNACICLVCVCVCMSAKSDNNGTNANRMTSRRNSWKKYIQNSYISERDSIFFSFSIHAYILFIRYAIENFHLLIFCRSNFSQQPNFCSLPSKYTIVYVSMNLHWNFNEVIWKKKTHN